MTASSAVRNGRRAAEALMLDTFNVYSPSADARDTDGFEVEGYTSRGSTVGKIQGHRGGRDNHSRTVTVEGVQREVIDSGLHVSVASPPPSLGYYGIGWEYECVSVGPASDPSLLGSRWLAIDAPAKSYATARRLNVVRLR